MAGGRKKEFDKQEALVAAMNVFWKKGYLGASLSDLIQAMGINKPSLYATFGNKEALFLAVADYYLTKYALPVTNFLTTETENPKQNLKRFIMASIDNQCIPNTPRGCFISLCSIEKEGDNLPEAAANSIKKASNNTVHALQAFFTKHDANPQDKETDGKSSQTPESKALAVFTLLNGTATMTKMGKSTQEFESMVDMLLDGMDI